MWRDEHSLYPYQEKASLVMQESDVLLAFEMGTGKTPTTLHAIESMRDSLPCQAGTVLVPASLKWQWASEVAKFTDQAAMVIDGSPDRRKEQYRLLGEGGYGYAITTYDTFVRDEDLHGHIARGFLVLDEATAIKNFKARRSVHIKGVRNLYPVRVALTGTPVENGMAEEIFSIMEFVDPQVLGKYWKFERQYIVRNPMGWITGYRNLDKFHAQLRPYVLRATHSEPEVAAYLPRVLHRDPVMVQADTRTRTVVQRITDDIVADLDDMSEKAALQQLSQDHPDGSLMSKIQALRMFLDLPSSLVHSATLRGRGEGGSEYAATLLNDGILDGFKGSPKLSALKSYVNDHLEVGGANKVVVFTSFVHVAEVISSCFPESVVFTGTMTPKQRDSAKTRFESDPECRVFVSTDAGGYGLNLPQANLLVNYDLPWQAGLMKQRNARIVRASSDWDYVVIQDFLVEGTIEERMADLLRHKVAVSEAIVDGTGITEKGTVDSDVESLRTFLKQLTANGT